MKKIIFGLFLLALVFSAVSCKSGKASCDAYGKIEAVNATDQASK